MKLKSYPKYKESGIQWVRQIPVDWKINKVKYLVDKSIYYPIGDGDHGQITPDMYQDEGVPYIRVQNLSWNGKILYKGMVYISKEINLANKKSILKPQDLLIAKTGATIGKIGLVPKNIISANTTSSVGKITINKKFHSPFFWNYYFQSNIFQNQIFISAYQKSAQPGFNVEDLIDFIVIIPSFKEQSIIANFLDKKTAEIDELIEKDKKLIGLLKEKRIALINHAVTKGLPVRCTQTGLDPNANMKDSEIEWIGKIPEEWEAKKLKQISEINISNVDKKSDEDESEVLLCNYIDVYKNEFIDSTINFMKATASVEQIRRFTIKMGDVIITKDSEEPTDIAIPALVIEDLKNVVCGYHLALIRSNKMILDGSFLFRALQSKKINDQFVIEANGVTRFGISTYPILNSYILIPPLSEQIQIAEYLDKTTSKIDRTIERIEAKIELLEEYKKSLIHHVVTGKIDVRGSEI